MMEFPKMPKPLEARNTVIIRREHMIQLEPPQASRLIEEVDVRRKIRSIFIRTARYYESIS